MAIQRFFYVTQEALIVWRKSEAQLSLENTFANDDSGFREFSNYLQAAPAQQSLMLVDVIEEEFTTDSMPRMSASDRRGLIARRVARRFGSTPFRLGVHLGRSKRDDGQDRVLYAAITNQELVEPWLEIITQHKVPLVAITSVPLLASDLLSTFRKPATNALFLSLHQGGNLRQVFIQGGHPVSARLTRVSDSTQAGFGQAVIAEVVQSRKYLERARYLRPADQFDVYLLADEKTAMTALTNSSGISFQVHIIDPAKALKKLGIAGNVAAGNMETLYMAHSSRKRLAQHYPSGKRTNYSRLLKIRRLAVSLTVASAVACSVVAGVLLTSGMMFRNASQQVDTQITRMEETFRRENAEFEPIRADSHEMKLTVDTGEYILRNTLPAEWVMQQVGQVMGDYPDMHLGSLSWEIETAAPANPENARRGRSAAELPVPVPEVTAVTARLSGEMRPFDGDLRQAFGRIDALAASLQKQTAFDAAAVVEYPIDARTAVSVSGEVRREGNVAPARFGVSLTLRIAPDAS